LTLKFVFELQKLLRERLKLEFRITKFEKTRKKSKKTYMRTLRATQIEYFFSKLNYVLTFEY